MISDMQYLFLAVMSVLKSDIIVYGYSFTLLDVFIFSFLASAVIYFLFKSLDH